MLGKFKRKDDFKIVAIVARRKFDSKPYDSFVEKEAFLKLAKSEKQKNFCD